MNMEELDEIFGEDIAQDNEPGTPIETTDSIKLEDTFFDDTFETTPTENSLLDD